MLDAELREPLASREAGVACADVDRIRSRTVGVDFALGAVVPRAIKRHRLSERI